MTNLIILVLAAIITYLLMNLYTYLESVFAKYELWKMNRNRQKDEIYQRKCIKLHNNIFNYYMSEIYYKPEITANSIANMHIKRLQEEGKIDKMYHLMKKKQAI